MIPDGTKAGVGMSRNFVHRVRITSRHTVQERAKGPSPKDRASITGRLILPGPVRQLITLPSQNLLKLRAFFKKVTGSSWGSNNRLERVRNLPDSESRRPGIPVGNQRLLSMCAPVICPRSILKCHVPGERNRTPADRPTAHKQPRKRVFLTAAC